MRHLLVSFMTCAGVAAVFLTGHTEASDERAVSDGVDLDSVLNALNSPNFATRQSAQNELGNLDAGQISQLAHQAETSSAAETAIGCILALKHHWLGDDPEAVQIAWEALETLKSSDRHLVREEAHWILSSHWKIRQKLAIDRLRMHGAAIITPKSAADARTVHDRRAKEKRKQSFNRLQQRIFNGPRPPAPSVQVFISAEWRGDLPALKLIRRLPGLQQRDAQAFGGKAGGRKRPPFGGRNRNSPPPVGIFLIGDHSLDADSVIWIRGAFGQGVQERGEVMLGITSDGATAGEGCSVRTVVPFGSADAAGLLFGDVITSLADRPIKSFADLVDELRNFSSGETVNVTILRRVLQNGRPLNQTMEVPVILRSWQNYVDAVNKAAAEFDSGSMSSVAVPPIVP